MKFKKCIACGLRPRNTVIASAAWQSSQIIYAPFGAHLLSMLSYLFSKKNAHVGVFYTNFSGISRSIIFHARRNMLVSGLW